jgi:hypothetical protein
MRAILVVLGSFFLTSCGINGPSIATVLATYPEAESTVAVTTPVWIVFDRAVDVEALPFSLIRSGGQAVTFDVEYDADLFVVTFTPTSNLTAGTTYEALLEEYVSPSGRFGAEGAAWGFSTGSGGGGSGGGGGGDDTDGDDFECDPTVDTCIEDEEIDEDFECVERCVLKRVKLKGRLTVEPGSEFLAIGVTVNGKSTFDGAAEVLIVDSGLNGPVEVRNSGTITFRGVTAKSQLDFEANHGLITLDLNIFGKTALASNTGGASLTGNYLGSLTCTGNDPAPTGSGNFVKGDAAGQCAGF